jgi:hypothetical protein
MERNQHAHLQSVKEENQKKNLKIAMKRKLFLPTAVPRRSDENV